MRTKSAPEIPEDQARGRVAEIYAELRRTLGIPLVNLVFRRMAAVPGCLEAAWTSLEPAYCSGQIARRAAEMLAASDLGELGLSQTALVETGVDLSALNNICTVYIRANSINLIGMKIVSALLAGKPVGAARRGCPLPVLPLPPPVTGRIPPMARLDELDASVRDQIEALGRQVHRGGGASPSFFRHFAQWPRLLSLLHARIGPQTGALSDRADTMTAHGEAIAADLAPALAPLTFANADAAARELLVQLSAEFPRNMAFMTIIAAGLIRRN